MACQALVVLDLQGGLVTTEGREKVSEDPEGQAFPWDGSDSDGMFRAQSAPHPALQRSTGTAEQALDIAIDAAALAAFQSAPLSAIGGLERYTNIF